ncbi:Uncharacterized protein dnm_096000 [Desulfonema magnum]|uniref:Uncharacterized protein n=1 Tax=Desulfonema magnum TaxID=45655 RepID=A0A975BX91_9BACT|nr:Uncharacterized protein dnm_096000 [Desulfonema magnum]
MTHPFFCHEGTKTRRHEDTKFHEVSPRFLCVFAADFFGCVKSGSSRFFATKARRHKVSRSLSAVPLCLCVFAADFFGCVKGGTHPNKVGSASLHPPYIF